MTMSNSDNFLQNCLQLINLLNTKIEAKSLALEMMCPNNPYTVEFMSDKEIGEYNTKAEMLKAELWDLKKYLRMVEGL